MKTEMGVTCVMHGVGGGGNKESVQNVDWKTLCKDNNFTGIEIYFLRSWGCELDWTSP
jgi:hypothetical protein